jgi:hypothetical protein
MSSATGDTNPSRLIAAHERSSKPAPFLLGALGFTLAATFILSMLAPAAFPADDGFFYLVIADHIAHGLGSTFNGIVETNGYHPLWLGMLALVGSLGVGKAALIYLAYILQFAMLIGTLLIVFFLYRRALLPTAWAAAIAGLALLGKGTLYLMETWLALLLLLVVVQQLVRLVDAPPEGVSLRRCLWLGGALGLMILARLALVFVAAMVWALVAWHVLWNAAPSALGRRAGALLAGMALNAALLAAYVALNITLFGSALPISGMIKSHFPHPVLALTLSAKLFWVVLAAIALGAWLMRWRARPVAPDGGIYGRGLFMALAALWGGLALDLCYQTFFSYAAEWYFVEGWALLILAVPLAITRLAGGSGGKSARPWLQISAISVLLLATVAGSFLRATSNFSVQWYLLRPDAALQWGWQRDNRRLAAELGQSLPAGTGVLTFDIPGILAYYTDLRIFPIDGLVSAGDRQIYQIFSPLSGTSAGGWDSGRAAEIARFANPIVGLADEFPELALTRLPCPAAVQPAAMRTP